MSSKTRNPKSVTLGLSKAKEKKTPFLSVEIPIWDNLSPYALKLYGQLRKLVDYTEEHDQTEITVERLAILSCMSIRKAYQCLNELEKEHHLIKRLNYDNWRYGVTNSYDIAQTYGFFKDSEELSTETVQTLTTTAQYAVPTAQYAVPTALGAYSYIEQDLSQDLYHVCGEAELPTQHTIKKLKKEKAEERALEDKTIKELFDEKFSEYEISLQDLFTACQEHYDQKSLWATKEKFYKWVKREKPENYKKISKEIKNTSVPTVLELQEYKAGVKGYEYVGEMIKKLKQA